MLKTTALTLALCLPHPNSSIAKPETFTVCRLFPSLLTVPMAFIWNFACFTLSVPLRSLCLPGLQLFPSIHLTRARLIFLRSNSAHISPQLISLHDTLVMPDIIFTPAASHSNTSVIWPLTDLRNVCFPTSQHPSLHPSPTAWLWPAVLLPSQSRGSLRLSCLTRFLWWTLNTIWLFHLSIHSVWKNQSYKRPCAA